MKKAMKQTTLVNLINGLSILAILIAMITFVFSNMANTAVDMANEAHYALTYNANRFINGSAYLTSEVRSFAATGDQKHYDNYWNEVKTLKNRDLGVAAMKEIGITSEEEALIDKMSALSNRLVPLEDQAMQDSKEGKQEEAMEAVFGAAYEQTIGEIRQLQQQFLSDIQTRMQANIDGYLANAKIAQGATWVMLVIVIGIQLVSMLAIRKRVIRPVLKVQQELIRISEGEISGQFDLESDSSEIGLMVQAIHSTKQTLQDYVGDIAKHLGEMAKNNMDIHIDRDYIGDFAPIKCALQTIVSSLNGTLEQITTASHEVSSGAEQVATGAQALSQGATEQASGIQELAATITEISNNVRLSAENAQQADKKVGVVATELNSSNEKMQLMIRAMDEISSSSQEIGKIIKTIEDIAFQTNILALNAAVEAARAGAAGKGFAVVAGEVRNLASKSAEAAKQTSELIEKSIKAVANGTQIADETAQSILSVVGGAQEITVSIAEISRSAQEQSDSISQVTLGVEQISAVVQTNSATAEQSAAASEELASQSQILREQAARFKLYRG